MPNSDKKTYALFSSPINKKITAALEETGAKVFQFPTLETVKIILDGNSLNKIKNLDAFDWLIFEDIFAVDYFVQILEENEIDLFEMDSVQICAFGEAVADRLRFAQIHTDVISHSFNVADICMLLSDYVGKDNLDGLEVLLPKNLSSESEIKKELTDNGVNATELAVYQVKNSKTDKIKKLKVLLKSGAIDEFIFSSPADLSALKIYFDTDSVSETLSEIEVSTADKAMIQTLREQDLKVTHFRLK